MSNLHSYSAYFFLIVLHVFTMRRHVVSSIQTAVSPTVTTFRSRINARIFPNHWFMTRKCNHHHRIFHSSVQLYGRQRTPKNDFDETSSAFETDTTNKSKNSSTSSSSNKTMKKENFPSKICVVCQRPFTWRKKWERSWDEITTCSKKCNSERRSGR